MSTRSVDDLVKALGAESGISTSEVSRICADLDSEVAAFRDRPLSHTTFPYVFLDATYCKARVNHRVVSQAVVIATGVSADGRREILGFSWMELELSTNSSSPGFCGQPGQSGSRSRAIEVMRSTSVWVRSGQGNW
ncbi:hypothetical protein Psi02_69380 [Planotetraspora silvatica]|uniref:Mutator family transposase n=1 Tax=Planotetraspora silvatica TaxID=234614 RepID=A0A8J3URC4_9ACTN|nr:hypothetical protein Psi02_69380 [Planotetraspora silvatica]